MSKAVIMIDWSEVPHLTDLQKTEMLASIPPYQRDARSKGIPQLGSGAILPVSDSDIICKDFPIPSHFRKCFGMDVGWGWTAAVHLAHDPDTDIVYLYRAYKRAEAEPAVHAMAIQAPGAWIPGVIDTSANGRTPVDGQRLVDIYLSLGLHLDNADKSREAGLLEMWQRASTGRLKVFASCEAWFIEKRLYRRDDKGRVVKKNDHLMDATRYGLMSGLERARAGVLRVVRDVQEVPGLQRFDSSWARTGSAGWMCG